MANMRQPTGAANRARPSELLAACKKSLVKHLLAYIKPAFESTKEALFLSAEKAASTALQNHLFEAQKILSDNMAAFTQVYSEELGSGFDELIGGKISAADQTPETGEEEDEDDLSLVGEEDLEESLAISDMVSKAEVRFTQSIYALNQRLTVLNRGRPIKNDTNPCAPLIIGKSLRHATDSMDLGVEVKVVLFSRFDRLLQKNMHLCYQAINDQLAAAGILPNIVLPKPKRGASAPSAPGAQAENLTETQAAPGQSPQTTGAPQPGVSHAPRPAPVADQPAVVDFFGRALQSTAIESEAIGVPAAPEIIGSIREMMSRQATASHVHQPLPGTFVVAPAQVVGSVLSQLQERLTATGASNRLSADEIKRSLTEALGNDPETGKPLSLAKSDAQTIDIIELVYDQIKREQLLHDPVQNMLHKMQMPMIRVAMQDGSFFEDTKHPAREFFNTVADAGELWLEDDPENSKSFQTIEKALDRVLEDHGDDNQVFTELLGDLNEHISLMSRKATLTERRHVDAAKGQEKLGMAREQARRLIDGLVKKYRPPKFVDSVLVRPWADYLTLIALRHGDDSEQWKTALKVAKTLIFLVRDDLDDNLKASLRKRVPWLRDELAKGLSQVGYFEQDVLRVLDNLQACYKRRLTPGKIEETGKAAAELEEELPVAQVAEETDESRPEAEGLKSKRPKRVDLNEKERAMVAKLQLLAFGTWFELKLSAEPDFVKRKLSWFSPVTGRCLFVNNRGAIAEEIYIEELGQAMAAGRARVYQPNKRPLIDRAFSAIFGRLKKASKRVEGTSAT
jgi:hypothetical protein